MATAQYLVIIGQADPDEDYIDPTFTLTELSKEEYFNLIIEEEREHILENGGDDSEFFTITDDYLKIYHNGEDDQYDVHYWTGKMVV